MKSDLEDGQKVRIERRFSEAVRVLRRGLEHTDTVLPLSHLRRSLNKELRLAQRGQKAAELHHLADLIRFRYGITPPAGEEASVLIRNIRTIWEERDLLLKSEQGTLDAEIEEGIRTDLLELAVVWASLRVQLASKNDVDEARREALLVFDQADASCGPSSALNRERRAYTRALGWPDPSHGPEPAPQSAWEHYDLGRFYLRSGLVQEASAEFQHTLERRPQDFWPNFYQGLCAYRLRQFDDAVAAFRTCIALRPTSAECFYNRALADDARGQVRQAFRDYSRALELNPGLTVASLNRGILSYKAGRHEDAIADFNRALRTGSAPETIGRIHYNLALAHLTRGDRAAALASAEAAVNSGYGKARDLRDSLRRRP
jgi:tetratricopeptide (TPR) repeat protein